MYLLGTHQCRRIWDPSLNFFEFLRQFMRQSTNAGLAKAHLSSTHLEKLIFPLFTVFGPTMPNTRPVNYPGQHWTLLGMPSTTASTSRSTRSSPSLLTTPHGDTSKTAAGMSEFIKVKTSVQTACGRMRKERESSLYVCSCNNRHHLP